MVWIRQCCQHGHIDFGIQGSRNFEILGFWNWHTRASVSTSTAMPIPSLTPLSPQTFNNGCTNMTMKPQTLSTHEAFVSGVVL